MLDTIPELARDWFAWLRGRGLATSTIGQYRRNVDLFVTWLDAEGLALVPGEVTSRVLSRYFADLADRPTKRDPSRKVSASFVSLQYRGLQQFWRWLVDVEEEITDNPFNRLSPPRIPEKPVPVFSDEELRGLLDVCRGASFEARRDLALVRLLIDTGLRASELMGLSLADLDLADQTVSVLGKGSRVRVVPFGDRTSQSVRRYLRARQRHAQGHSEALWLGSAGRMTTYGLRYVLDRRGGLAGVTGCRPHRFRHTFAHRWLASGGAESDLMRLCGWSSREMLLRYGLSAADERARDAHRRKGLGDLL